MKNDFYPPSNIRLEMLREQEERESCMLAIPEVGSESFQALMAERFGPMPDFSPRPYSLVYKIALAVMVISGLMLFIV